VSCNFKRLLTAAVLFAGLHAASAFGCDAAGQRVTGVMAKTDVGVYNEAGDFERTIEKRRVVVDQAVVACKNSPALVKIKLSNGEQVWVDRLEVKVEGGAPAPARECKARAPSSSNDKKEPGVSGIDPCSG
jgi:hypothetical protein